jgi:hypothetical protein
MIELEIARMLLARTTRLHAVSTMRSQALLAAASEGKSGLRLK